jgi:hypothetical protein
MIAASVWGYQRGEVGLAVQNSLREVSP